MGGVGDALVELARDLLDRALALGEQVDDLGPPPGGERLGDLGEPLEEGVLRGSVTHAGQSVPPVSSST